MNAAAADELLGQLDGAHRPETRAFVTRQLNGAWRSAWLASCAHWVPSVPTEDDLDGFDLFDEDVAPPPSSPGTEASPDALDADAAALKRLVAEANAAMTAVEDTFGSAFRQGESHVRVDAHAHLEALRSFVPELERALRGVLALPELLRLARK